MTRHRDALLRIISTLPAGVVSHLMAKLGVASRTEAATLAIRHSLVAYPPASPYLP